MQDFRDFLENYLVLIYTIIWNSGISAVGNYEVLSESTISWKCFDLAKMRLFFFYIFEQMSKIWGIVVIIL